MNNYIEGKGGHGAIPINKLHRRLHKSFNRSKVARGMPFDWTKGFDVRDVIGQIPIKNQGGNSSCGGQSSSYAYQISRLLRSIKEGQVSAKSFYAPIAYKGGGTTVTALTSQFCGNGANLELS